MDVDAAGGIADSAVEALLFCGRVGERRGIAKAGWNLGSGFAGVDGRPSGVLPSKIISQCRE